MQKREARRAERARGQAGKQREQRKSKQSTRMLNSIQMGARKTASSNKMEMVVEGLESQSEVGGKALSVSLWRIQESFAVLLTNREMAPLRLPAGCNFPLESTLHIPALGFRCVDGHEKVRG